MEEKVRRLARRCLNGMVVGCGGGLQILGPVAVSIVDVRCEYVAQRAVEALREAVGLRVHGRRVQLADVALLVETLVERCHERRSSVGEDLLGRSVRDENRVDEGSRDRVLRLVCDRHGPGVAREVIEQHECLAVARGGWREREYVHVDDLER